MNGKKILVAAGDYNIISQVKQGLEGSGCVILAAHSHRDALFIVHQESFDLVLVDGAMADRLSGERTAAAISTLDNSPQMLIYTAQNGAKGASYDSPVLTSLSPEAVRASVLSLILPDVETVPQEKKSTKERHAVTELFWRDEEIQTLFSLSRSLTEVLDLSEVLNRVVEAARRLTNAEEGMILLPESDSDQLYLRAKVGIDQATAHNFRVKTQDSIAGHVFCTGESMLLGESGLHKVKTQYFVNSLLYVPIMHKAKPVGVLGVNNKSKHDVFNDRHRELLINLSSYAAIAIENARIHGQSVRRARELKALVDASQAINTSLSIDRTLPAICEQLVRVLNASHAEIFEWKRDDETQVLQSTGRFYQAKWRAGYELQISLNDRPAIRSAIENRRHVLILRDRHDTPSEVEVLQRAGAKGLLLVPVTAGELVIGALQAFYVNTPHNPPSNDAIQKSARLIQETWLSHTSSDEYTTTQFFKLLADVNTLLGSDWVEYALISVEKKALLLQYAHGCAFWRDGACPQIDISRYPDLIEALETRSPVNVHLEEGGLTPGFATLLKLTRSRAILGLPLMDRGQMRGMAVFADIEHNHRFSAREIDLARGVVAQAATALENTGLISDLEASLRELKETQNRLIQAARLSAMGELAAAVAHQINNPLTTIVLDTELLMLNEQPGSKNYEVLSAISRSGKRAAGVVRRLLATARPNSPTVPPQAINVVYTIEEILALIRSYIQREGMRLVTDLPSEPPPSVLAVPGELDDVWLNLILNAHDALVGMKDPEIGVKVTYDAGSEEVEVVVWDNGPGIPENIVNEIFKPFFTTKPTGEGTGLGLHICRQVIDRVGGTITVQSTPNEGTRFAVRLPITRSG